MKSAPPEANRSLLEVRGPRASSVIVQRIPANAADVFMDWQRGITAAAAEFPGYQATEIYPPFAQQQEWVVIIHFDDPTTLQNWLGSAKRNEWIARLPCEVRDYRLRTLPSGFGSWFAGLTANGAPLPHWKSFLAVLLGLYPTAMVLTLVLWPHLQQLELAVTMLISNTLSASFLEWLGMPVVSRLLRPWFRADGKDGWRITVIGLVLILATLGAMLMMFRIVEP